MRMVPNSPLETGSRAEKRVFERLRHSFDDRFAAYHSLKPTRHPYKQFPEIDFAICCPEGIYVLEVKGGGVSCDGGVWRYEDRFGRSYESLEGPFRQAEAALRGLVDDLGANLPAGVLDRFAIGYGVVFPDCEWQTEGAEWDRVMLADARRSRDVEGWLSDLFEYWRGRQPTKVGPDDQALETVQGYLRPEIDTPASESHATLADQIQGVRQRIERLTDDQMRMADVADANPRVLCFGGAGTGKTFLAERLARRWAGAGAQVALVCRSPWLRHYLASRLPIPGLNVSLIEGVRLDCQRGRIGTFRRPDRR